MSSMHMHGRPAPEREPPGVVVARPLCRIAWAVSSPALEGLVVDLCSGARAWVGFQCLSSSMLAEPFGRRGGGCLLGGGARSRRGIFFLNCCQVSGGVHRSAWPFPLRRRVSCSGGYEEEDFFVSECPPKTRPLLGNYPL
ncbi:hypothetical protein K504DRAFT_212515 [Pleomassaria siparia CBS 279.74]|uniref:Uncharacterized protein n=1 Tax=Pleomassaria siparia CBS 279.74 TaxID=1314801 RepID=A0A6G1KJM3_9PLEO|nr:hypothetical protein K504DRAFT_212515 [Pleomassaria siparia CBS 279.74]